MVKSYPDRAEKKVEKVVIDTSGGHDGNGPVKAVLYRKVDDIGVTTGFVLHVVFSGKDILGRDAESLFRTL